MSEPCKIFIGNLAYKCTDDDLYEHFGKYGKVTDAIVVTDRESGRSRGFGFVTFNDQSEADDAISACHESDFMEREINVRHANSRRGGDGRGSGFGSGGRSNFSRGGYSRGGGYRSNGRDRRDDYNDSGGRGLLYEQ